MILLITGKKMRIIGEEVGGGWGTWVMDIRRALDVNEHWVL